MRHYISPESLRTDSYRLAAKVVQDGFKPDFVVAIWRGGAPVGCYVHEFLKRIGQKPDHIAIRTSRYTGIDETASTVQVHNLGYLLEHLTYESKVLLVDDIHDTGLTIKAIKETLLNELDHRCPHDIRVATVYNKPSRNQTGVAPNYFVNTTDLWEVFPHELEGMSLDEIANVVGTDVADLVQECSVFQLKQ